MTYLESWIFFPSPSFLSVHCFFLVNSVQGYKFKSSHNAGRFMCFYFAIAVREQNDATGSIYHKQPSLTHHSACSLLPCCIRYWVVEKMSTLHFEALVPSTRQDRAQGMACYHIDLEVMMTGWNSDAGVTCAMIEYLAIVSNRISSSARRNATT